MSTELQELLSSPGWDIFLVKYLRPLADQKRKQLLTVEAMSPEERRATIQLLKALHFTFAKVYEDQQVPPHRVLAGWLD